MRFGILVCFAMWGTLTVSAEGKKGGTKNAAIFEEGRKVYEANCAVCHGVEGKGDGAAAVPLEPKPRDFTDAKYMNTRTTTALRQVIAEGGQSAGLSPIMVGWSATLSPDQIESVLHYIRVFSRKNH